MSRYVLAPCSRCGKPIPKNSDGDPAGCQECYLRLHPETDPEQLRKKWNWDAEDCEITKLGDDEIPSDPVDEPEPAPFWSQFEDYLNDDENDDDEGEGVAWRKPGWIPEPE